MAGRRRSSVMAAVLAGALLVVARAGAQGQPGHEPARDAPGQAVPRQQPRNPGQFPPDRVQPNSHAAQQLKDSLREHGAGAHDPAGGHGEHATHAEHDENAPPEPINWWHGLLGEKEGVPPSLLWREPGAPPPFLAALLNFGVLVFIAVRYGKRPLSEALLKRKENIVRDLEDAKRLREAAEKRLAEYEAKLAKIHEDFDRVRLEFREQGERDKQRIVAEAKERRERMKKDAEVLLAQEVKQMRQDLVGEVVRDATRLAAGLLAKEMTLGDHDRFAEMFLTELRSGGRATGSGAVAASAAAKGRSS